MAFSTTVANDLANYITRGQVPTALTTPMKISLHTSDPLTSGLNEVLNAGGSAYARQVGANAAGFGPYSAPSGGAAALTAAVNFTSMPGSTTVTHIGIWDSSGTPKFIQGAALATPKTLNLGDTFSLTSATDTITG